MQTSHTRTLLRAYALFLKEVYKRLHWRELIPHRKKVCMKYNALVMCLLYATIQATGQNKQEESPLIEAHPKMACESCYNPCSCATGCRKNCAYIWASDESCTSKSASSFFLCVIGAFPCCWNTH